MLYLSTLFVPLHDYNFTAKSHFLSLYMTSETAEVIPRN